MVECHRLDAADIGQRKIALGDFAERACASVEGEQIEQPTLDGLVSLLDNALVRSVE